MPLSVSSDSSAARSTGASGPTPPPRTVAVTRSKYNWSSLLSSCVSAGSTTTPPPGREPEASPASRAERGVAPAGATTSSGATGARKSRARGASFAAPPPARARSGWGLGFSGIKGCTPSTASQCGTTLTATGGRGSFAASTSFSVSSFCSWKNSSGCPGTSRKGTGPAPAGNPYRGSTSRSRKDALTSSVEMVDRLECLANFSASWITSRRRYSASGASARATSSGNASIPTVCAITLMDSGETRSFPPSATPSVGSDMPLLARPGDEADATRTREHVARARRRVTQGTETPPHENLGSLTS